jgi:hypothetical protein
MQISYRLGFEDYYDALLAKTRRERLIKKCAVAALAGIPLCLWIRSDGTQNLTRDIAATLLLLVIFSGIYWLEQIRVKSTLKKATNWEVDELLHLYISDAGIKTIDEPDVEAWTNFSGYTETTNSFVLYQSKSIDAIIPKKALNEVEVEVFRRILSTHVRNH